MEIVIKIPEELYKQITVEKEYFLEDGESLCTAVANGTPLPKGHGRLIDEEQIPGDGGWDFSDRLMLTPTIIEADKESEEKNEM